MRTGKEITIKIQEMMERELKAFYEDDKTREWLENKGCTEHAEDMKTAMKHHVAGYARLSELLDWINEK